MGVHVSAHGDLDEKEPVGRAPHVLGRVIIEQEPVMVGLERPGRHGDLFASYVFQVEIGGAQVGTGASVVLARRHQHAAARLRVLFRGMNKAGAVDRVAGHRMRPEGQRRRLKAHALTDAAVGDIDRFALGAVPGETEPAAAEKLTALVQTDKAVQRTVIGVGRIDRFPQDGPVRYDAGFDFAMRPQGALAVLVEGDRPPFPPEIAPFSFRIKNIGDLAAYVSMIHVALDLNEAKPAPCFREYAMQTYRIAARLSVALGCKVFPGVDCQ